MSPTQSTKKSRPWHFSVSPFTTVRWGEQHEFVFTKNLNGDTVTLSRLDWDEEPVFFFGAHAKAGYKNFSLFGSAKIAAPSDCGKLIDSDWQNRKSLPLSDPLYDVQTNFSSHTNHLNFYYILSGGLSYDFNFETESKPVLNITFSPFADYYYSYSSFTGRNGYLQYGNYDTYAYNDESNSYYEDCYGDMIQLERITYKTWLGCSTKLQFERRFSTTFSFALCPFIHVDSLDSHFHKTSYYFDKMSAFVNGFKIAFEAEKKFSIHNSAFIRISYENIPSFDGKTLISSSRKGLYYFIDTETSGASFEWFEFTLGYKFSL